MSRSRMRCTASTVSSARCFRWREAAETEERDEADGVGDGDGKAAW